MTAFLLRRPVSVWIAALGLVVLGGFSLARLPLSLLPTLERPRLSVTIVDAERSRSELLHDLVIPLERRLQTLDGVVEVFAVVEDGQAVVRLETEWQTDVDRLRIEAQRRLVEISSEALDELRVEVDAGDAEPILRLAVFGGRGHQRTELVEKVLVPELGRLPGAGEIRLFGTSHLRAVVEPRAADLAARGLTAADVLEALSPLGAGRPLGRIREGAALRPLIVRREVTSLDALAAASLPGMEGLRLGDVAEIRLDEVPERGLFRRQGRSGVLVEVYRAPGANAVQLAREGREAVRTLARGSGPLQVELITDRSREVVESLGGLGRAGLLGLLLGTAVLRFMLGRWRPTLALAVVIPVSVVAAFSAFYFFDVSLDIVSLAGLALATGMLVDNSIVVLESIFSAADRGSRHPVVEGTEQIAVPLIAGFLTTAVVFLPLIYLRGLARAFFGVQAFAIVSTLVISLALSLTLTPTLTRSESLTGGPSRGRSPGLGIYGRVLGRALGRPGLFAAVFLVVLGGICALVLPVLPSELIPAGDSRALVVDVHLPEGLTLEEAERRLADLEEGLASVEGIASLHTIYRGDVFGRRSLGSRDGDAELELELEVGAGLSGVLGAVETAVLASPGLRAETRVRSGAVSSVVERASRRLELEIQAETPRRVERLAERVAEELPGRVEPRDRAPRAQALAIRWDPVQLARLRADEDVLGTQVVAALGGFPRGRSSIPGSEAEIWLAPTLPADLESLPLRVRETDAAAWVPLGALAHWEREPEAPPLERRNGRPSLRLTLTRDPGTVPAVEDALSRLALGSDEKVAWSGEVREVERSFDQLRLALGLALILVFLTVAALYESLAIPLAVMVTVPVAAAGGLLALAATGQSLNVMSFLGLILLAGIVVNNAIVLVHRAEQLAPGRTPEQAVRRAAAERYRPILMTTLTTLLGMIPLGLLGGEGVELRRALATTVCGGLVTSWIAALLVVPALYLVARRGREVVLRQENPRP